jgi:hypothetical protein
MKAKLIKEGLVLVSESVEDDLEIWRIFNDGIALIGKAVSGGKTAHVRKQILLQSGYLPKGRTKKLTKFE